MVGFDVASREFHNRAVTFNQIVVERTRNFVDSTYTHGDHVVGVGVAVGGGVVYDYAEWFEWPSGVDFAGGINDVHSSSGSGAFTQSPASPTSSQYHRVPSCP